MGNDPDSTFEREREIFFAALEKKTGGSRAAYLQETCGDDAAMLGRVREMLENHGGDETETFLKPQDVSQQPGALMEREGSVVGNYKLVDKLGEGGFGVVWMAEQEEPVKRKVALKLIKPGMDSAEVIARFGAERQALAVMDHPNIAKVFDAGATESGRPYFVMELADGVPITDFCDREKLNTKARLELFAVVCGAVQHAHQKAVIHRDLKPSNILVVDGDDGPVPKVIDFGIAKAIGEEAGAQTAFTAHGQLVGTPQYMSPEQAGMEGSADIDTRSDVYSLGVVLYELLAGSPPFDVETLRSAGFEGMCRIIREEEPMRPSIRLGTASGDDSTRITSTRGAEPQRLSRQVRGELDWIVMKAIEKERGRRYETANGLAADIGRYLNDEPVSAGPPSAIYRFKKFARRNKAVLTTAALVASVLVAATGVSVWQAVEAHRARVQSDKDKEEAEAISAFMVDVFQSPDPARDGRTITVAEMLDTAAKKLETELADQPGRRAKLQAALAKTYYALGLYPKAIILMEEVREYHLAASGAEHADTLRAMGNLAAFLGAAGRLVEAIEMGDEVLALSLKVLGAEHPDTLASMSNLARSYFSAGRRDEALDMQEEVLALSFEVPGLEPSFALTSMQNLANSYVSAGRRDEALHMQEVALEWSRKVLGAKHPTTLMAMNNLTNSYEAADRLDEALKLREEVLERSRKVLGQKHPSTLMAMGNLANSYEAADRLDEALKMREEVLELSRKALGDEHAETLLAMNNLATSYFFADRLDEALKVREEVLERGRKVLGQKHPTTLKAMGNLADSYEAADRLNEALKMREGVLERSRKVLGDERAETLLAMSDLANSYEAADRLDDALELREEAVVLSCKIRGDKHPDTIRAMGNLANSYEAADRLDEAIEMGKEVLKLSRKVFGAEHPDTIVAMNNLASSYYGAGHLGKALEMGGEMLELYRRVKGAEHPETITAMHRRAVFLGEVGKIPEALEMGESVVALCLRKFGPEHPETINAMGDLANTYNAAGHLSKAREMGKEVLALFREIRGDKHPETVVAMSNAVKLCLDAGRIGEAISIGEEALRTSQGVLGTEHPDTITVMINLALAYRNSNRLDEALKLGEDTLILSRRVFGAKHPKLVPAVHNLALVYRGVGRFDEALKLGQDALSLQREVFGPNHPFTWQFEKALAIHYLDGGDPDGAGRVLSRLLLTSGDKIGVSDKKSFAPVIGEFFREWNVEIPAENPSDAAISEYYESNKDRFGDTSIHLLTLSFPKLNIGRESVEPLHKWLTEGGDFAAAAREHSDDSAASKGGDRGWVKRGYFAKELDEVAFALKAGEVSEVIEDATHFRILKVVERKAGTPPTLDEVREEIVTELKEESRKKRVEGWIEEAKKELAEEKEAGGETNSTAPKPPVPANPEKTMGNPPNSPDPENLHPELESSSL